MVQYEEILKRLGLPKHSGKVYEILLKNKSILPAQISEKLKVSRPAIYTALKALEHHGFIFTTIQGKRIYYVAGNPILINKAFENLNVLLSKKISESFINKDKHKQEELIFLEGHKGIQDAFDDVIKHSKQGETFYRYTSEKNLAKVNMYLSKDYRKKRDIKKLERLVISNPESGKQKRARLERFIKYIPQEYDLFQQDIIQLIYGERISFIDLNTERVFIINNKALADFQKVIFKILYRKL